MWHSCALWSAGDTQTQPQKKASVEGWKNLVPDVKWKCTKDIFFKLYKSSLFWWDHHMVIYPPPRSRRWRKNQLHQVAELRREFPMKASWYGRIGRIWGGIRSGGWKGRSIASFCWVNIIISALSTSSSSSSYFGQCEKWWKSPKIGFSSLGSMVSGVMKF